MGRNIKLRNPFAKLLRGLKPKRIPNKKKYNRKRDSVNIPNQFSKEQ